MSSNLSSRFHISYIHHTAQPEALEEKLQTMLYLNGRAVCDGFSQDILGKIASVSVNVFSHSYTYFSLCFFLLSASLVRAT